MGPLISAEQLRAADHLDWVVLDCRFSLGDSEQGRAAFDEGHITNAHYAHLDRDLSSPVTSTSGRHPLPEPGEFCQRLGDWGITPTSRVVVYDDAGGLFAARAWWLLRWLGHDQVALLDGGIAAWKAAGGSLTDSTTVASPVAAYPLPATLAHTASAADLVANIDTGDFIVTDARAANRYAGLEEPIDPVAGHIPGAINRPVSDNLDHRGCFKPARQLREEWQALLGDRPSVAMCGSGVTACHNLLAMEIAGIGGGILYPGSWSEWIRDPARPVATASPQKS